ncbi:hypothetical protein ACRAWF_38130 [Streptomyces sp. L7]
MPPWLPLADGYSTWLQTQREKAVTLPEDLRKAAEAAIDQAEEVCHRIAFGIDVLSTDDDALEAFRFANRAMALQRRNTAIAARRAGHEDDPASYRRAHQEVDEEGKEAAAWRPFQLAFVLLNLASLSAPGHPHRGTGREALVDLLFFPTGGGKTEAYLGLAAYTFALRRLQGIVGSAAEARDGSAGVAVLMRYTLRLLTAQQFQRAAALVSACESAAQRGVRARPALGRHPVPYRAVVGTSVSPNWFGEAQEQIAGARESASDKHARVIQVLSCPWCGQGLTAHSNMDYDPDRRRVLLYCPRGEGEDRCPFFPARLTRRGHPRAHRRRGDLPPRARHGHRHRRQVRPAALERVRRAAVRPRHRMVPAPRLPPRRPRRAHRLPQPPHPQGNVVGGGDGPARHPAAAPGPDHPGRAAPDLRRARHHRRTLRSRHRPAVQLVVHRRRRRTTRGRPEDRRVHSHHQARRRAGARRLRP